MLPARAYSRKTFTTCISDDASNGANAAATAVTAVLVVAGNLLTDLGVAWIDPRMRREKVET